MREQLYACEPQYLLTYLTKIENATAEEVALAAGQFGAHDDDEDPLDEIYEEEGDEALIKISGPLTQAEPSFLAKLFGFGGTSYGDILKAIDRAHENPVIKRLRLQVNSPGGEVAGVDHVWQALRAWGPNCVAENHGLMASAAYWASSAAGRIVAMSPAAETGSIGVVAVGIDDSDLMKNLGVKKVTILSKNAPDKDYSFATTKGRSAIQDRANEIESVFLSRVAEGRKTTIEKVKADFGQGRVKIAEHQPGQTCACALHCGMIDAVTPMVPNTDSRKQPGAAYAQGRETMKLTDLLTANPEARAEFDKAVAEARAEGKIAFEARVATAKPYLSLKATKDGYDTAEVEAIAKAAVEVITGVKEPGALQGFVSYIDLNVEKRKLAAAQAETDKQKETPGQHTPAMADLLVKAAALKIDIKATEALAKAQGLDPLKAIEAQIQTAEQLAADKARLAAVGG
jgi:ClpP class serine protease